MPQKSATVAGSSLTGTFATIITPTGPISRVLVTSDCNQPFQIHFGDSTQPLRVPASTSFAIDLFEGGCAGVGTVQAKHDGAAPTSGSLCVMLMSQ